jgi:hypothetical protein
MIDITRGFFALVAAAAAGVLIWTATLFDLASPDEFWAVMGILAGAGLVLGVARSVGPIRAGLRPRFNLGVLLLALVPAGLVGAWILLATQPQGGWQQERLESWSSDIGVAGLVADLGVFAAVIAFGLGVLLAFAFGTAAREERVVAEAEVDDREAVTELRVPYETREKVTLT